MDAQEITDGNKKSTLTVLRGKEDHDPSSLNTIYTAQVKFIYVQLHLWHQKTKKCLLTCFNVVHPTVDPFFHS